MVKIVDMDESVTIKAQLEEDVGTVILLNKFTVNPEDIDQFLKVFEATTKILGNNRVLSRLSYIVVLLGATHSLTMLFGSLQSFSNGLLIVRNFSQA